MPELSHIDPGSAALLVMDDQVDNLTRFMTAAQSADAIACVPDRIATSRDAGMMVIHVVVSPSCLRTPALADGAEMRRGSPLGDVTRSQTFFGPSQIWRCRPATKG
jgi:hypothetical protein